jgi:flagellar L-ring protein precursor FlgH
MRETNQTTGTRSTSRQGKVAGGCLLFSLILLQNAQPLGAHAESLFRASTTYNSQGPVQSRSLFTPPIAREVGDRVTIQIDETTAQTNKAELKITRNQTINENGSSLFNNMVGFMVDKIPFIKTSKIKSTLSVPSFNGLDNANTADSKAEMTHATSFQDNISCQVVQVLPSGDLMVQGQKVVQNNKERQVFMVTGIVKPYYLDRNNEISSKMVGNLQMIQSGKGVISRQQSDGIANKVYQFFN